MMVPLALGISAVLLFLAIMHLYWAAGGAAGAAGAVPEVDGAPAFVPRTIDTLAVALALTLGALVVLGRAGLWTPGWAAPLVFRGGVWLLSVVFLFRSIGDFRLVGFFKRIRGTRFARRDTLFYSPLCFVLGVALLRLALLDP